MIEHQAELWEPLFDLRPATRQVFFIRVNQYEIVHITDVVFYPQPFLYEVVEVVEYGESHKLWDLRAEPDSHLSAEWIHDFTGTGGDSFVFDALSDRRFRHVVTDGGKIVMNVAL